MDNQESNKPPIEGWSEGIFHFLLEQPIPKEEHLHLGYMLSKQIVALYFIEIMLKYTLDELGITYDRSFDGHNLHKLFDRLPGKKKWYVNRRYKEIINNRHEWVWDVCKSVDLFLKYLGKNPITESRYFWESGRNGFKSQSLDNTNNQTHELPLMIMPDKINSLVLAFIVELHGYPSDGFKKNYDTKFRSLADSFKTRHDDAQ